MCVCVCDGFVEGGEGKQDWLGQGAWMWHNWREASGEEEGKESGKRRLGKRNEKEGLWGWMD